MDKKIDLDMSVQYLKGVGPTRSELLNKIGIYTVKDLIMYYPRVYEDRTEVRKISEFIEGESVLFKGVICSRIVTSRVRNSMTISKGYITDGSLDCKVVWFNQKYIANYLKENEEYLFYGKIEKEANEFKVTNPIVYKLSELEKIKGVYPIYPLTKGITQKYLFSLISGILTQNIEIKEILPSEIIKRYSLCSREYAIKKIHMPKDFKEVAIARKRLIFEELLLLTIALQMMKSSNEIHTKNRKYLDVDMGEFLSLLPFSLTGAQSRTLEEIKSDMYKNVPMSRMVQGDVGSGKTIVAACSIYIAVKSGYQAAMMAPTTILASQHYLGLKKYFDKLGIRSEIITSNTTKKQKQNIIEKLEFGIIDVIFGTHALIEENIKFKNIALVITDEQHRFGVNQRIKLSDKGDDVDILVMTATPIPRSLALLLYGDLDLSVIDELPPGRKKIETYVVGQNMEKRIENFIEKQILEGRQIYVVCPLVEESEMMDDLKSVEKVYNEYISGNLKKYKVEYLHGKMKPKEKDEVMQRFAGGSIDILISTTVIEVGVDVPNATCMIIEDSDRFGLAQLHQLRGRVGRGEHSSYCILKTKSKSKVALERLKIMEQSSNGFEIAEKDLELRGPGDFFGIRQSGLPEFKLADLLKDINVLKLATVASREILDDDFSLKKEENQNLRDEVLTKYEMQLKNIGI